MSTEGGGAGGWGFELPPPEQPRAKSKPTGNKAYSQGRAVGIGQKAAPIKPPKAEYDDDLDLEYKKDSLSIPANPSEFIAMS